MRLPHTPLVLVALASSALLAGCGSSVKKSATYQSTTPSTALATTTQAQTRTSTRSAPSALQAEATSVAAGDIPDNQVFIGFQNASAGYSMKYPEGWAQQGNGASVTFRDKNNIVRVIVASGATPTAKGVRSELSRVSGVRVQSGPQPITIAGALALKVVYTTESAPNAVTGKRVILAVDRYYLSHGGKEAIVDLGTPQGVDNVDAYRMMIESFRWK
jgi:uncharacterized protein YceK